jgi:hypothetical protein
VLASPSLAPSIRARALQINSIQFKRDDSHVKKNQIIHARRSDAAGSVGGVGRVLHRVHVHQTRRQLQLHLQELRNRRLLMKGTAMKRLLILAALTAVAGVAYAATCANCACSRLPDGSYNCVCKNCTSDE